MSRPPADAAGLGAVDRRPLQYFLAVVDHGTFVRAAESLFIAQSALSAGIKKLERTLGGPLFERLPRGVKLTALGEAAIGPARHALRSLDAVEAAAAEVRGLSRAHLVIATISTLSFDPTAPLIGALRRAHPGVTVKIIAPPQPLTSAVVDLVKSGEAEIGISEVPPPDPALEITELPSQEMYVVLPRSDEETPERCTLEEVFAQGLIVGPYWEGTAFVRGLHRIGSPSEPHIVVRTVHRNSFVTLAMAGAGATFVPPEQAERARRRGARVTRVDPPVMREIAVVHRKGYLSPAAELFMEHCRRL